MDPIRGHIAQWGEYERPLVHPGMRQDQTGCASHQVADCEQVEVERACGVRRAAHSAGLGFESVKDFEQLHGISRSGQPHHAVHEVRLIRSWPSR